MSTPNEKTAPGVGRHGVGGDSAKGNASDTLIITPVAGKIKYSRGSGTHDATPEQRVAATPDAFIDAVLADRIKSKTDGFICAPCGIAPNDAAHRQEDKPIEKRTKAKSIGKPHRCATCAEPRAFIGLDIDESLSPERFEQLKRDAQQYHGLVYTTARHTPEAPRCRLLFTLDRPLARDDLQRATWIVQWYIGEDLTFDRAADRAEQALFLPLEVSEIVRCDGAVLPADCLMAFFDDEPALREDAPCRDAHDDDVREALTFLDPDDGYDHWLQVGMALHESLGDDGRAIWDEWSHRSKDYDASELADKWSGFGSYGGNAVTVGTVFHLAKIEGWVGPTRRKDDLASRIEWALAEYKRGGDAVNRDAVARAVSESFWSPVKGAFHFLNGYDDLARFNATDAEWAMPRRFGRFVDPGALREDKTAEAIKLAGQMVLKEVKYRSQRNKVSWRVDMYATEDSLRLRPQDVDVVLQHRPFPVNNNRNDEVVEDYRRHFREFDDFLRFLVASRFAGHRKQAYLWLRAESDFGKDLLVGVLRDLGLVVSMSPTEIKKVIEGSPSGKSASDFLRTWALVVNEFRSISGELKQLELELPLAAKNELQQTVPLYAKIFTSADSIESLAGPSGVEDQLANRFSGIQGKGKIVDREVFRRVGDTPYRLALSHYAAVKLNEAVERWQSRDPIAAATEAQDWLKRYIAQHSIGNKYGRVSDHVEKIGADVRQWMMEAYDAKQDAASTRIAGQEAPPLPSRAKYVVDAGDKVLVTSVGKVVDDFIKAFYGISERPAIRSHKDAIYAAMSVDGKGATRHRAGGDQYKAVLIHEVRL